MTEIVVIGIGNPDRGDDAIGVVVARELKQATPPGVTVIEHRGDAADLVERLARTDAAILVDAAVSGAAPGTFRRIDVHRETLPAAWFACSTHGLGLATAIELAGTLGSLPCHCIVYAVEAEAFDHGAALSAGTVATIPAVTEAIGRDLARLRAEMAGAGAERRHA
jgi:hydrogenase maturation protease